MSEELQNILSSVNANFLNSESLSRDYSEIYRFGRPFVSIKEFIEDDYYFGKIAKNLYPENVPDLLDIFNVKKNYIEIILTGATSIGKTFLTCIAMCYIIGQIGAYINPHRWIGGSPTSPIIFINMSINATKARDVIFTRIKTMIDSSPYFREEFKRDMRLQDSLTWRLSREESDIINRTGPQMTFKPGTGDSLSALGDDIYAGIGDELNFFRIVERSTKTHGEVLDPAQKLYDTVSRRMKGRFSSGGLALGKFFLLSSAQYPDDFIERRIREAEADGSLGNTVKLIRKSIWEAKKGVFIQGKPIFGNKTFRVELGTSKNNSRVLDNYNDKTGEIAPRMGMGIKEPEGKVTNPPVELYPDYDRDVEGSVRDFGGDVTRAITPFFPDMSCVYDAISLDLAHPWSKEETTLEDGSGLNIETLFEKDEETGKWILKRHKTRSRYAAVDLGATGDALGIGIIHLVDWKQVSRGGGVLVEPIFEVDLLLRVVPPTGGEIKFSNMRSIFINLRNLGMNFGKITFDSWQSRDSIQILTSLGFIVDVLSVDKEIAQYNYFKSCFSEYRMVIYNYGPFFIELMQLEKRGDTVDHIAGGRKDVSDGFCGAVWNAFQGEAFASPDQIAARMPHVKETISPQRELRKVLITEEDELRQWMGGRTIVKK